MINFIIEERELVAIAILIALTLFLLARGFRTKDGYEKAVERVRRQHLVEEWTREKNWISAEREKESTEEKKVLLQYWRECRKKRLL